MVIQAERSMPKFSRLIKNFSPLEMVSYRVKVYCQNLIVRELVFERSVIITFSYIEN